MIEQQQTGALQDLIASEYGGGTPPEQQPPVLPPETEPPAGGTPGEITINLQEFEGVKTPDELKSLVERGRSYSPELETELQDLRKKKTDFETLAEREERIKNFNPYKNPNYYRLEKIAEARPEEVGFYQQIVMGNVSEIDLIKAELLKKHPGIFKEDPDALQTAVENEFPALFDQSYESDSKEYKDARLKLRMKASDVRKQYLDELNAIEVPDVNAQTKKEAETREGLQKSWTPKMEAMKKELDKLPVVVTGEKGKDDLHYFDIDIPEEDRKQMVDFALKYVMQNQIPLNDESIQSVKEHMQKLWIIQNIKAYTTAVAEEAAKAINGEWRKSIHHPRKPGEQTPPGAHNVDGQDQLYEILKTKNQNF